MARVPLAAGEGVGAQGGDVVVAIPVFGAVELFRDCLESVLRHTHADVAVLVADDATPGEEIARAIDAVSGERPVLHLRQARNVGFPLNANAALAAAATADVALVNSDCVVAAGWLDGLRAAALSDSRIATASALSNNGSILSVHAPSPALPGGRSLAEVASKVRSASARRRPRIPTAIGHCVYVRRAALELAGDFDAAFSPGYGEEVDFSQRCLLRGLVHVAADEVYVFHRGAVSLGAQAGSTARQAEHEREIARRYPYYHRAVEAIAAARHGPLADSLAAARRALDGLSLTVDASALGPVAMGTQVTILALVEAYGRAGLGRLRVALARSAPAAVRSRIEAAGAEIVHVDEIERGVEATDVVHRPSQLTEPKQLDWLHRLGERIVVTQQDLIAYANPGYFASADEHAEYRALTRQALAIADRAVFISERVRAEALAEELIDPARALVVPQGVDHASEAPAKLAGARPGALLLCIGTDFLHKNRVFALEVFDELRTLGFEGRLVLAGPHMSHGSSRAEEDALLGGRPALAERVDRLGQVSDGERAWLYENAALVLYPTVAEGFGLVPFEAARAGVPCMFAPESALVEVAGAENATIVPWDPAATARAARALLDDSARRRALVESLARRSERYTWDATAARLVEVFGACVAEPVRPARAIYFGESITDLALSLVGPGGYLPAPTQRALLAVAARPALRRPILGTIEASYRALRAVRRLRARIDG